MAFCLRYKRAGDIQVAIAPNEEEAVKHARLYRPNLPRSAAAMSIMNGIEATKQTCLKYPNPHVVIVSGYNTHQHIHRSLNAGALAYALKVVVVRELIITVRLISQGDWYFSIQTAEIAHDPPLPPVACQICGETDHKTKYCPNSLFKATCPEWLSPH